MPNKLQERFLIREYKSYFKRATGLPASFRSNPKDPPDFWLYSPKCSYAVEVTNIVHEQNRTIAATQWRLVREAESESRAAGILSGKYIVAFHSPLASGKQKSEFKRSILDFVAKTACLKATEAVDIIIDGRSICDVQKHVGTGANIYPLGGGIEELGGWEDDIRQQLYPLLERAIQMKAKKMASHRPAILVLYDLFWIADETMYRECVCKVPEARFFDQIYVVKDIGAGYPALTNSSSSLNGRVD